MKNFKERISDISSHLQSLTTPEFSSKVQDAVERKDQTKLAKLCRQAKIPRSYTGIVISVLLSVSPEQKWPVYY